MGNVHGKLGESDIKQKAQGQKGYVFVHVPAKLWMIFEVKKIDHKKQKAGEHADAGNGHDNIFIFDLLVQGVELDQLEFINPFPFPNDHFACLDLVKGGFDACLSLTDAFFRFILIQGDIGLQKPLADIHNQVGQAVVDAFQDGLAHNPYHGLGLVWSVKYLEVGNNPFFVGLNCFKGDAFFFFT